MKTSGICRHLSVSFNHMLLPQRPVHKWIDNGGCSEIRRPLQWLGYMNKHLQSSPRLRAFMTHLKSCWKLQYSTYLLQSKRNHTGKCLETGGHSQRLGCSWKPQSHLANATFAKSCVQVNDTGKCLESGGNHRDWSSCLHPKSHITTCYLCTVLCINEWHWEVFTDWGIHIDCGTFENVPSLKLVICYMYNILCTVTNYRDCRTFMNTPVSPETEDVHRLGSLMNTSQFHLSTCHFSNILCATTLTMGSVQWLGAFINTPTTQVINPIIHRSQSTDSITNAPIFK